MPQPHRAFTLMELLVVVSLIAILSALLLPTLAKVREGALGTRCASNLRNIALASSDYSQDWDGMLVMGYTGPYGYQFWYQLLAPGVEESGIINSPAKGRILRGCPRWRQTALYMSLTPTDYQWTQYSGYCLTQFLLPQTTITASGAPPYPFGCTMYDTTNWGTTLNNSVARITKPTARPFIFDASHASVDMVGWWPQASAKASLERHNQRANVLYFDGHCERNTWAVVNSGQYLPR